jgi:hypothetical protein
MWLLPGLPEGRVWRRAFRVPEGRRKAMLGTDIGRGVCDIASGLIAVILPAARMPHVLGWFEPAASTISIGGAIVVLRSNGPKATVYGVHGAAAVVLLATAALLFT